MKKQVKILSIALIVLTVLLAISNVVLATDIPGKIDTIAKGNADANTDKVVNLGATIVTIMQTVGIVVAVVVLLILGIKYMMGSAEEKAEYKKTLMPYVIGAVLVFAASTIAGVIFSFSQNIQG